ncbi:hypothetical protein NCCP2716_25780 [Sporosarcina sp. NCCP-2716]|uniref:hypothetical protein n=1 Tax=Sporosarcina sp. NCCP-2716 TaxID=2943679 RepID=UPI00203B10A4|nr:hypothetical protein [Sporosarcina sp. NCCP-2716]GKV70080.1 hypothetical protein NCCP2716_25780 [Sporosarcina sp. NCCP-2716]
MKLVCKLCNLDVSKQVIELQDLKLLNKTDGQDLMPESFYIVANDEYFAPRDKGCFIINSKDVINSNFHSDQGRLNGCCGYDGCDGMNRVCLNNHEIGTECSDCWMSHFVAFNPESVRLV